MLIPHTFSPKTEGPWYPIDTMVGDAQNPCVVYVKGECGSIIQGLAHNIIEGMAKIHAPFKAVHWQLMEITNKREPTNE